MLYRRPMRTGVSGVVRSPVEMRTRFMSDSRCLDSWASPGLTSTAMGKPVPSVTRCSLLRIRRERPNAWSWGSSGYRLQLFLKLPAAARLARTELPSMHHRSQSMCPSASKRIWSSFEDLIEDTALTPVGEVVVDRLPRAVPLGKISPRCTGPHNPHHAVEHDTWIPTRTTGSCLVCGNVRLDQFPLCVTEFVSTHCADLHVTSPGLHARAIQWSSAQT